MVPSGFHKVEHGKAASAMFLHILEVFMAYSSGVMYFDLAISVLLDILSHGVT